MQHASIACASVCYSNPERIAPIGPEGKTRRGDLLAVYSLVNRNGIIVLPRRVYLDKTHGRFRLRRFVDE